jgi:hypothetical protein
MRPFEGIATSTPSIDASAEVGLQTVARVPVQHRSAVPIRYPHAALTRANLNFRLEATFQHASLL